MTPQADGDARPLIETTGTPERPIDRAVRIARDLNLTISRITARQDGRVSSLYLRRPDGRIARVSDHRIPPWLDAPIHHADLFIPRRRPMSDTRIRRALRLLAGGRPRTYHMQLMLAERLPLRPPDALSS